MQDTPVFMTCPACGNTITSPHTNLVATKVKMFIAETTEQTEMTMVWHRGNGCGKIIAVAPTR